MKKWSGNFRAKNHDYASKSIYHITLMKAEGIEPFGRLAGDWHIPVGHFRSPFIIASPVGEAIKSALRSIPEIHPAMRLYQYALMPDHLHMILSVESQLDEAVGRKIAIFKNMVNTLAQSPRIFELGFNDQILYQSRRLEDLFRYLRENPYRLAVRIAHPEYFRRINSISFAGQNFSAYGNIYLLRNPFKEQVVVHRRDSAFVRDSNLERWKHTASNGGVLVSPFISRDEKEVRKTCEELGGRIILISNQDFGDRGKPSGHDFDQCEKGSLLILTPTDPVFPADLTREACLAMNSLAEMIANS